jgi:potassium-dependent mechanosensitive channel
LPLRWFQKRKELCCVAQPAVLDMQVSAPRMTKSRHRFAPGAFLACAIAIVATSTAPPAAAQTSAMTGGEALESLKGQLASARANRDLEPGLKAQVVETYENAIAAVQSAIGLRAGIEALAKAQEGAEETIQQLERELRALRAEAARPAPPDKAYDELPLDTLERLENRTREEVDHARLRVAERQRRLDEIVARPLSARLEQAELRESPRGEQHPTGAPPALAAAQQGLARAREAVRQARLAHLEREIVTQPTLARIAQLELYVAQADLDVRSAAWRRARALLEARQRADIAKARVEAARATQPDATGADPARALEARALERRAQIAESALAVSRALAELSERRQQLAGIERTLRAAKERASAAAEGRELNRLLLGQIRALPTPDQFQERARLRARALADAADVRLDVELERARIADLDHAVADALAKLDPNLPAAERAAFEKRVRTNLAELQRLLERLDKEIDVLLRTLRATDEAESALLRSARDARTELVGLLLWIPIAPVNLQTFDELRQGAEWITSAANWRGVVDTWRRAATHSPIPVVGAALIVLGLLLTRGWFNRKLRTLVPGAIPLFGYRLRHALEALALTLLLALPLPLAIWTAGRLLDSVGDVPLFAQGAAAALQFAAAALLFFLLVRWLAEPSGVMIRHFNWHAQPVLATRRELRRLMLLYVPLAFAALLGTLQAPEPVRQSLGRITFALAMAAVAIFWGRAFPPRRELVPLDHDESTIGLRLINAVVVHAPVLLSVALIVLSLAGFYFLAIFLHEVLIQTISLVFAVSIAEALVSLWVALQRVRLAEVEAQQARAAARMQAEVSGESPAVSVAAIDADAIDAQTRQLLNMITTIVIGLGLWLIWSSAFERLDFGRGVALWSYTETVDGKSITRTIPLSGVLLALAVSVIAYIGTRNIGGMLDIVLLQRLRLQADANYAIKTAARYVTAGLGIVIATHLLGVKWSSVQWLIAALGVGLGFGLQEIVANFVSGLIVLGERPIRIGDVVTVGETSGAVTRIRARATVITDWDNKEVLIPNKAFITERVINWTLSSQTTRLLLKIGVAYGTDPARAQEVLAQVVRANPDVLADPAPSVFFTGFGESSLDFQIRAFVGETAKRLRVTHELNTAISRALAAAGIEIPFPQRDVHIRSAAGPGGFEPKVIEPDAARLAAVQAPA